MLSPSALLLIGVFISIVLLLYDRYLRILDWYDAAVVVVVVFSPNLVGRITHFLFDGFISYLWMTFFITK